MPDETDDSVVRVYGASGGGSGTEMGDTDRRSGPVAVGHWEERPSAKGRRGWHWFWLWLCARGKTRKRPQG
jgi:hypothetical protein